jgi:hypothetical protein
MRFAAAVIVSLSSALAAHAGEITSAYTNFDLDKCPQVEAPDEYVFEGSWSCKGYGGFEIYYSGEDARSYVAFGRKVEDHCAQAKTFFAFNTALSPVEWRLDDGKPFAVIERWSLTSGENVKSTWLVVTALAEDDSCHAAYVGGSYPNANEAARKAADEIARGFSCADDVPKVISEAGDPPIDLKACREIDGLNYE